MKGGGAGSLHELDKKGAWSFATSSSSSSGIASVWVAEHDATLLEVFMDSIVRQMRTLAATCQYVGEAGRGVSQSSHRAHRHAVTLRDVENLQAPA